MAGQLGTENELPPLICHEWFMHRPQSVTYNDCVIFYVQKIQLPPGESPRPS